MKGPPSRLILKTPAKINLLLCIKRKRSDGYHDIITVMQMVDLWDEIIIEEAGDIDLITSDPEVPSGQQNLIYKTAYRLKECSDTKRGARISLHKVIPVAGGLGGGSSDAAATLFGLNILWGLDYSRDRLMDIGGELGSDIPFFFNGPSAIGYGRGDKLIPLINYTDYWFLLINPGLHLSTAWAYSQMSPPPSPSPVKGEGEREGDRWIGPFSTPKIELTKGDGNIKIPLRKGIRVEDGKIWLLPFNDLEEVVHKRYPIIREIKEKMVAFGAMYSLMSGSGSTVFGIFEDRGSAERAHTALRKQEWRSWVMRALDSPPYSNINYQT